MNKYLWIAAGVILYSLAIFFVGRISKGEKTTVTAVTVNIDSARAIWTKGKVDSADLAAERRKNADLDRMLSESGPLPSLAPIEAGSGGVPVFRMDTSEIVKVHGKMIDGEDTLQAETTTTARVSVVYIGEPHNVFGLTRLTIDPFTLPGRVTKTEPTLPAAASSWLAFRTVASWNGQPGAGAQVDIGPVGLGVTFIRHQQPLYQVSSVVWRPF